MLQNSGFHLPKQAACLLIVAASLMASSAFAQTSAKTMSVDARKKLLEAQHEKIYAIDMPQHFIYDQLMPEIRKERVAVAPHFPQRGATEAQTQANIKNWLTNHPEELDNYVLFLSRKLEGINKNADKKK